MFSLLTVIIALLLVAAIAAATIYYGGSAYVESRETADASAIINQGLQIRAAVDMHKQKYRVGVSSLDELVEKEFLVAIPSPSWGTNGNYAMSSVPDANVCVEANRRMGIAGVPLCGSASIANSLACCATEEADVIAP